MKKYLLSIGLITTIATPAISVSCGNTSNKNTVERTIVNNSKAIFDFEGRTGVKWEAGIPFAGGAAKDYEMIIGSGQFIPGFESQMIGMKTGETRIINIKFPKNYAAHLADKEAMFKVTINYIFQK